jgi:hypothetical protein
MFSFVGFSLAASLALQDKLGTEEDNGKIGLQRR